MKHYFFMAICLVFMAGCATHIVPKNIAAPEYNDFSAELARLKAIPFTSALRNREAAARYTVILNNRLSDAQKQEVYFERGKRYQALKMYREAISDFSHVTKNPDALEFSSQCFEALGNYIMARRDLTYLIKIKPTGKNYLLRADLEFRNYDYDNADVDYQFAVVNGKNDWRILNAASWFYSQKHLKQNPYFAIRLARMCVNIRKDAYTLDTEAAAYASGGYFAVAYVLQKMAISFIKTKVPDEFNLRLNVYKQAAGL